MTYGSAAFWDGKSTMIKNTLERTQNKALRSITGAFKTTPTLALEIEASIPPIDITLEYYTERYATRTQKLDPSNPVVCRIPEQYRGDTPVISPPPLPYFPPPPRCHVLAYLIKQHEAKAKKNTTTRLIRMAKSITPNAERIDPLAETPWRRSEYDHDICDRIRLYIPENNPGTSSKLDWAEDHSNLNTKKTTNSFSYTPMAHYPTTKALGKLDMG